MTAKATGVALPPEYRSLVKRGGLPQEYSLYGVPLAMDPPEVFGTRKAAEVWLLDNLGNLRRAGVKTRPCMCCGREFFSLGFQHRKCGRCKRVETWDA